MNRILLLLCSLLVVAVESSAQSKGITPMHTFFQKYADSTIILEYNTDSYDPNYYFILTKTGDTVNSFRYLAKMKFEQGLIPKDMKIIISMEKYRNYNDPATINSYFSVVNLNQDTLKTIWSRAIKLNAWKIVEDNSPPICPDNKRVPVILDCGDLMIQLITKERIKNFVFNCPLEDENYCPGNYNRMGAIGIEKLFRGYFPDTYH